MTEARAAAPSGDARLVLLATSARVAPGLLSAAAWDALRSGTVCAADESHPQLPAVRAAGVRVRCDVPADAGALLDLVESGPVVWLLAPEGDDELVAAVRAEAGARGTRAPGVEVLDGSYDVPGARLLDLVSVMDRLRSPGGCPWDADQTHRSLATYLVEETYETLEAIETGDDAALREELGDLLLQVMFHARIAEERPAGAWSVDDVAADITAKLVRRHPHVFADTEVTGADDVGDRWEVLKRAEKQRDSAMDGVPLAQPALSLASKVLHRTEKARVDVRAPEAELPSLPDADAVGDVLLAAVAAARSQGIDAEQALRDAVRRFIATVHTTEREE
ncbi:XTP/dITP diphosphohydrolase [Haloactinopolyspora alba]|uniref:XTP/dITP diphosphohydrolase n=1 Tax=Haloactinopolyspora alba TaxID=648780 RepID=A0A2P8E5P2_9ACTN|nr:MazG family protein [Haloactinopolyspora alba]PSL04795.1 XTP/dITP diphosphohydrolase [Haloactinopolyspora alba]